MSIKELQKEAYEQAKGRGLYDKEKSVAALLWHIRSEAAEAICAWKHYKDLKTHYECSNTANGADCIAVDYQCPKCEKRLNTGVEQELADVIIMTLSACEHLGIDIDAAIKRKMEFNAIRDR